MSTQKMLLPKKESNNQSVVCSFGKANLSTLMQNQYQNWSCVLDPAIALSHHGVFIAENIGKEIELWVVRELWNIVEDADYYLHRPELINPELVTKATPNVKAEIVWSLKEWEKLRQKKDLARLGLYWLGDNLQESFLPEHQPFEFFQQWEALARALDDRIRSKQIDSNVLTPAFRDAVALVASLGSGFILTYQLPIKSTENHSPTIIKTLESWGISSQVLNRENSIVAMERQYLTELIVRAGLGKLLLAGVNLVVFHLVIPAIPSSENSAISPQLSSSKQDASKDLKQESYFWTKAKGYWYYL